MSNNSIEFENLLNEFYKLKAEHSKQERKLNIMRKNLLEILNINNTNSIKTNNFILSKSKRSRESISKQNLPNDIWEKFKKTSEFEIIDLKLRNS